LSTVSERKERHSDVVIGWLAVKSVRRHGCDPRPAGPAVMPPRSKAEREAAHFPHLVDEPEVELPPPPEPPEHLSEDMRSWWRQITEIFILENHHVRLLQLACEAWDRQVAARQILAEEGLTIETGTGSRKPHPAVGIEREAKTQFARLLRELDLDTEMPKVDRHNWPPRLKSNRIR
jgi:P27 family predicted phage terminase small subunit